ncbi:MAG TPA: 5'-nucleotidase, lipoprotein e(P4) family [Bacteroidales bacterium]|nr:5'-nucleotidase, lipoprotein e(P4) family [Bacteroidales bacterium]
MNQRTLLIPLIIILMSALACNRPQPASKTTKDSNDYLLAATLYQQQAAEFRALCYQAYNIAHSNMNAIYDTATDLSRLAIVMDLDETVLDNSAYEAQIILDSLAYPHGWDEWMYAASAKALPGAVDFIKSVEAKGVHVFYITNRREKYREATIENLKKLDIAPLDSSYLMLRLEQSTKEPRRLKVLENYQIVMLFGDNLVDFAKAFDGPQSSSRRAEVTDSLRDAFGNRFIVFPNVMYGDWLNAITDNDHSFSPQQKLEKYKAVLEGFEY